jgi:uncharacterized protein
MRSTVSALLAGLLMGCGLLLSGMSDPARVLGFFDVAGQWDPTLAFVMAGGLAIAFPGFRLVAKRRQPLCAERFSLPAAKAVDSRLLGGAAIFGIGWGLVGYCPGPALAAAAAGVWPAAAFSAAMGLGMLAWHRIEQIRRSGAPRLREVFSGRA